MPLHVLLGEASGVAAFCEKYWKAEAASAGTEGHAGLESVRDPKRGLTEDTAEEIRAIAAAVQEARTEHRKQATPKTAAPTDRGTFLVDELSFVLEWYFDDGVEDEKDAQLAAVVDEHAEDPDSSDALAAELDDYADLANEHGKAIDGLGGFDAKYIDEAKTLANELRSRPATPQAMSPEAKQALSLRNRLITLLSRRVQVVRSAARFVFRQRPDIIRQATSAHERRRRAARLRKAKKEGKGDK